MKTTEKKKGQAVTISKGNNNDAWAAWMRSAAPWMQAPKYLAQEILRGWTFAGQVVINENNSSAPDVEQEILAKESYGRQLGKILDALAVLVQEAPSRAGRTKDEEDALKDLLKLYRKVEDIKNENMSDRLERINRDLDVLQKTNEQAYRTLLDRRNGEPLVKPRA